MKFSFVSLEVLGAKIGATPEHVSENAAKSSKFHSIAIISASVMVFTPFDRRTDLSGRTGQPSASAK
jgi:hypothetical protein